MKIDSLAWDLTTLTMIAAFAVVALGCFGLWLIESRSELARRWYDLERRAAAWWNEYHDETARRTAYPHRRAYRKGSAK